MKKMLCLCAAFAMFAAVGCDDKKTTPPKTGGSTPPAVDPAKKDGK